jgi:hypothetical protein
MRKRTYLIGIVVITALLFLGVFAVLNATSALAPVSPDTRILLANAAPQALAPAFASPPPAPEAILDAAVDAMAALDAWQMEMGIEMGAQYKGLRFDVPFTYAAQFQAPGRMESTVSTHVFGVTLEKEMIFVLTNLVAAEPSAGEGLAEVRPATVFAIPEFAGLDLAKIKGLELVGEEALDDIPVYHVRGTIPSHDMKATPRGARLALKGWAQCDVWIGVADSLLRQFQCEGDLTVAGSAQGTLHMTGAGTFFDYGQPLAAGASEVPRAAAGGAACAAAGPGFVPYTDPQEAVSFCHPSDWVVDDLVAGCGYYAVSTTGVVGPVREIPECLVLVYPHQTVARFGRSLTDAFKVCGQTGLCFSAYISKALLSGDTVTLISLQREALAHLTHGFLRNDPILGQFTAIQYGDARAVAVGCLTDQETFGPTVEAIAHSVVVGKPAGR